jgi:hypothetical protein
VQVEWLPSYPWRERRLAAQRRRRLRQALGLYGFNESDGLPTDAGLEQERDEALVELIRDFRLLYGTPKWRRLEQSVMDAAAAESRRITEAGVQDLYRPKARPPEEPVDAERADRD